MGGGKGTIDRSINPSIGISKGREGIVRSGVEHSPSPRHDYRVMRVMVMLLPPRSGGHCDHRRSCWADDRAGVGRGLLEEGGGAPEEEEDDDDNDDNGGCLSRGPRRILSPRPWRGMTTTTMTTMSRHCLVMRSKTLFFYGCELDLNSSSGQRLFFYPTSREGLRRLGSFCW